MAISETMTGKQSRKQNIRYISTKAAPPPLPTSKGNFQIFPKPTADPAAASIKPNLELNSPRCAAIVYSINPVNCYLSGNMVSLEIHLPVVIIVLSQHIKAHFWLD